MSTEIATPDSDHPIGSDTPSTKNPQPAGSMTAPTRGVIVQKFGGSSLADAAGIQRAAARIASTLDDGYQVVAVVSAMGDTTDELYDLAAGLSTRPQATSLDALLSIGELVSSALLAIALSELGRSPRTFTGSQAGLITDGAHGKARITDVRSGRIRAALSRGEVPVVAGFQGRTKKAKVVTTLGRGGSDLTAVALAASLGALTCEIYTDVDGVFTADPRIVPTARKIAVLSSEEMLELAASGCKVLHARCVCYARRFGMPIRVRSSFRDDPGTLIVPDLDRRPVEVSPREQPVITGVTSVNSTVRLTIVGLPDAPEGVSCVFDSLARSGVIVETVRRTARAGSGRSDVALIIPAAQVAAALTVLRSARGTLGFEDLRHGGPAGRVAISGVGMRSSPEVLCTFLNALSAVGVDCDLVEISETGIGGVTRADRLADAERAVRLAFGVTEADGAAPRRVPAPLPAVDPPPADPEPARELVSASWVTHNAVSAAAS